MRGVSTLWAGAKFKVPAANRNISYPSVLPLELSTLGGFCSLESPADLWELILLSVLSLVPFHPSCVWALALQPEGITEGFGWEGP